MKDIALGQYYPAKSVMHRLDPRIKILLVVGYIVMIFAAHSFVGYAMVAVFLLGVIILSRVPFRTILRTLRPIIFLVGITFVLTFLFYNNPYAETFWEWRFLRLSLDGLFNSCLIVIRLLLLVMGTSLLTLTTTPVELTDGIESLLFPLRLVKFPVHELAMIMSMALRLIPTLMEETDRIINAQKARCAEFESRNIFKKAKALIPVLIPLFVSSFRRSEELADAIDSRCYRGAKGRTKRKRLRIKFRDIAAVILYGMMLFVTLVAVYNYFDFEFLTTAHYYIGFEFLR
ncbi:MAG: energy-coupling factor transporter transmembrane protein EcfT [Firmicutes bacterium]|nr:energy-coupling factor transporter transmembrane protein EcfT [Bacillota bacterium]